MAEFLRYGEEPELQDVLDDPAIRQLMAKDGASWDYLLPMLGHEPALLQPKPDGHDTPR